MNYRGMMLAAVVGLGVHGAACAQIYESRDAEGVTEFSDTSSPGAEAVNLGSTNIVDPARGNASTNHPESPVATPVRQPQGVEQDRQLEPAYYGDTIDDDDLRAAVYERNRREEHPGEHRPVEDAAQVDRRSHALDEAGMARSPDRIEPRPHPEADVHPAVRGHR